MPELPEVETIRRGLEQHLIGLKIEEIQIRQPRLRRPVAVQQLKKQAEGRRILVLRRRAKYLLFDLDSGQTLIMHLGMSGRVLLLRENPPLDQHDHAIFSFRGGLQLRFRDPRRFGLISIWPTAELDAHPLLCHLGEEPLSREFPSNTLYEKVKRSRRPIKNLLMDAGFIVGVGNIYANEALFYAGLHPQTPASRLSIETWYRLAQALQAVLRKAIQQGGTTLNDFVNSQGEAGYFQLSLAVYGREGKPCLQCGSPIRRIVLSGRSCFYCPQCQPAPEE